MALTILYDIASDTGSLTGNDGWAAGMPVSNLRTDDVQAVARFLEIAEGPARMVAAFNRPRPINAWALIGHTCSTQAQVRVGLASNSALTDPIYQADLPAWEPTVVFGSVPWGAAPFDGVDKDTFPGAPVIFHRAGTQFGGWGFIEVADPSNNDGYLDFGRLMIGQSWQPPGFDGHDYGSAIQVVDTSTVQRTRGNRRIVGDQRIYRTWEIKLSYQTQATALGVFHDLQMRLGKSGSMLIIWDDEAAFSVRSRLTLYCALSGTSPITISDADAWDVTLSVEELT
ncbi:hypothetical protein [Niveispirillum cyanobacteriorum]|uniref:Uncharacterized protein n=1 Tax=Niveispirillum cyanobacteriorum TaxID=1612173 RepID=A0A2K9NDM4_9PROT|nr:hypothetical protein [Niveispirillum cyanobacteriorum]AUN31233.1 hypothetical protein C0V82_14075 [Niveispirillum cyanobacteriorum]GGE73067.1 hypothetical protein GCM10011317_32890 [Niveispirillum cyanobacteriorum]